VAGRGAGGRRGGVGNDQERVEVVGGHVTGRNLGNDIMVLFYFETTPSIFQI
jgi:hypothetical protein